MLFYYVLLLLLLLLFYRKRLMRFSSHQSLNVKHFVSARGCSSSCSSTNGFASTQPQYRAGVWVWVVGLVPPVGCSGVVCTSGEPEISSCQYTCPFLFWSGAKLFTLSVSHLRAIESHSLSLPLMACVQNEDGYPNMAGKGRMTSLTPG